MNVKILQSIQMDNARKAAYFIECFNRVDSPEKHIYSVQIPNHPDAEEKKIIMRFMEDMAALYKIREYNAVQDPAEVGRVASANTEGVVIS